MTIRRYILIGIPAACIISIVVSLVMSKPKREIGSQKEKSPPSKQVRNENIRGTDTATQTVQGLTMPNYDAQGKEVAVMRGAETFLLNDNVYKIVAPEIEVLEFHWISFTINAVR